MTNQPKFILVAEVTGVVGDIYLEGPSPVFDYYRVFFEDDGRTGYLYALDLRKIEQPIVDAIFIYNVHNIVDRERPSLFQIAWSSDGLKAALFINKYPHAVVDFESQRSYCRTGHTLSTPEFEKYSHEWTDECLNLFVEISDI